MDNLFTGSQEKKNENVQHTLLRLRLPCCHDSTAVATGAT